MAGMTQSARNCTSSSGPPLGSISLVAGLPVRRLMSAPARLARFATPRKTGRQKPGLHGAGSMNRRSLVFSRVTFNRKTSVSTMAPSPMSS